MSQPQKPAPAKLVINLLLRDRRIFKGVLERLLERFGPVDMVSAWIPFDFTRYYEEEMGEPLIKRIVAFKELIQQDSLAGIKQATNEMEVSLATSGKRSVNLDPGYLLLERFVLATGKNFTHRIYIGEGLYADLTLIYQNKDFQTLPWTYPDYASEPVLSFLRQIRKKYRIDIRNPHD